MSRRGHHRRSHRDNQQSAAFRPDTPGELQAAGLSSPFFREMWNTSSKMSWQQFVARWEHRFTAPKGPSRGRR